MTCCSGSSASSASERLKPSSSVISFLDDGLFLRLERRVVDVLEPALLAADGQYDVVAVAK